MDVHRTICAVDIAGYGSMDRTRPNLAALRAGMYASVEGAFAAAGIPWEECFRQDGGDSILALVPGDVPKGAFAGELLRELCAELDAHNEAHPPRERLKLRMALHAGEVTHDDHGVNGPAIIHASRLRDAPPLKRALGESPAALAVIASEWFFAEVIRHNPDYEPDAYRKVAVEVKELTGAGWIRLPGHELPAADPPVRQPETPVFVATEQPVFVVPPLRPASPKFYEVVDALEDILCMQNEHTRAQVVDELRFAGMIRYFNSRRAHLISILRTCTDFENGVLELVNVIVNQESSDSVPLKRLLTLLTSGGL